MSAICLKYRQDLLILCLPSLDNSGSLPCLQSRYTTRLRPRMANPGSGASPVRPLA